MNTKVSIDLVGPGSQVKVFNEEMPGYDAVNIVGQDVRILIAVRKDRGEVLANAIRTTLSLEKP